ncbi:MAG: hypothetical protein JWN76_825 [Chitinophagaceae bacterium]|nr:hypothetical protein [Chitinophagaceae bacterium]
MITLKALLTILLTLFCSALFAQQHSSLSQTVSLRLNKITTMSLMIGGGSTDETSSAAKGNILPNEVALSSENTGMKARANSDLVYSTEAVAEAPVYVMGGKGAVLPDAIAERQRLITVSSR